jgi:hypothetical protein
MGQRLPLDALRDIGTILVGFDEQKLAEAPKTRHRKSSPRVTRAHRKSFQL